MKVRWLWLTALCAALITPCAAEVNHGLFAQVLKDHVKDGKVDYPAVKHDQRFDEYLESVANAAPSDYDNDAKKLALFINAYNAFVIKGVIDHWPVTQVVSVPGFFDKIPYTIAQKQYTLDQLENEQIRGMGDARIHAALVCASKSCPGLRGEPYSADRLDAQLDEQARAWVNDTSRNRLDKAAKKLLVSKIFDWYKSDFEQSGGPAGFVRKYIDGDDAKNWLAAGDYTIEYLKYDWDLNSQ